MEKLFNFFKFAVLAGISFFGMLKSPDGSAQKYIFVTVLTLASFFIIVILSYPDYLEDYSS
jgi:hypothetical protein